MHDFIPRAGKDLIEAGLILRAHGKSDITNRSFVAQGFCLTNLVDLIQPQENGRFVPIPRGELRVFVRLVRETPVEVEKSCLEFPIVVVHDLEDIGLFLAGFA